MTTGGDPPIIASFHKIYKTQDKQYNTIQQLLLFSSNQLHRPTCAFKHTPATRDQNRNHQSTSKSITTMTNHLPPPHHHHQAMIRPNTSQVPPRHPHPPLPHHRAMVRPADENSSPSTTWSLCDHLRTTTTPTITRTQRRAPPPSRSPSRSTRR